MMVGNLKSLQQRAKPPRAPEVYERAIRIRDIRIKRLAIAHVARNKAHIYLGEIRPDLDALLAADSVCLRTIPDMPQSGNL